MRRPAPAIQVDTNVSNANMTPDGSLYELTQSPSLKPRTSIDSSLSSLPTQLVEDSTITLTSPAQPAYTPPKAGIRLLFSLLSSRDFALILLPAICTSMLSGGIAPFMTQVVGDAFNSFAQFPTTPNPPQSDRDALLHGVGIAAVELVALSIAALALSSITSALWISAGERNVMRLRQRVYEAVTNRDMDWFDTKMGSEDSVTSTEGDAPLGAGGLMAKFARETDEVRMASSLAAGMILQYLTTCIACLILAFIGSWSLTLVILSAVPLLIIIQGFSQASAGPLLANERQQSAQAATLVERAVSAISTVKAFNAASSEYNQLVKVLDKMTGGVRRLYGVWGLTSSLSQFTTMAMFVQGFWFGSKLVRDGSISPGSVMAVFWACLIATSNLQMCMPQFIILTRGKWAMVSLVTLIDPPPPAPSPSSPISPSHTTLSPLVPLKPKAVFNLSNKQQHRQSLCRIRPAGCEDGFGLYNVSFAYPSRPTIPVLINISMFLPLHDFTFIVGGSGSGKSTIAQLLAQIYRPTSGDILLNDQDLSFLDERWTRQHVAVVSQNCILFDMSVHDNVAMGLAGSGNGRNPEDVSRQEVINVCTAALMHQFVKELPEGYDTRLGTGGANLSGGQKQRLAIARAQIRNPTVLILDEATSALDPASRVLVFEAIKSWRKNKTTIVITHDLSQITSDDFVYVLKSGSVAEQGFRADLELSNDGEFKAMMNSQGQTGGFLPRKDLDASEEVEVEAILEKSEAEKLDLEETEDERPFVLRNRHQSLGGGLLRPAGLGNALYDVVADLKYSESAAGPVPSVRSNAASRRTTKYASGIVPVEAFAAKQIPAGTYPRRKSLFVPAVAIPPPAYNTVPRRYSLQFTPTSPTYKRPSSIVTVEDDLEFDLEKAAMERSGLEASKRRVFDNEKRSRTRWDEIKLDEIRVDDKDNTNANSDSSATQQQQETSFFRLLRDIYPSIPNKPLLFLGLVICLLSGAMTPLFSFLLSRLLFEVSIGATNVNTINTFGGIVLAVAATDGLLIGLKFFIMESVAMSWVQRIRQSAYSIILSQDKKWFDRTENSAIRMVSVLIKDGDDARNLIAVVVGQFLVVGAMLSVGCIWALIQGWQLTLAGFAIGPVFAITMSVQARLVAKAEKSNKVAREDVAKSYYESISNIRAIRSMAFESVFQRQFDKAVVEAHRTGVRGAFVEGCTYGVASALIYLAEALLFFVGAVLVSQGTYTYLQMVEVLNLVVFSVSIGSQLMAFTERIAKATAATRDFQKVLSLSTDTDESHGISMPPISGDVCFNDVSFSYPERPDVPVLQGTSLRLKKNECVAIVGASGCGKSTVASLLQRLYEPTSGRVTIGSIDLTAMDVRHLREHVAVVSQNPNLFDATISENIAYGSTSMSIEQIHEAAKAAHVHEFILSLPKGYDTMVGENASLISGGQAQRLQIARALARPSNILILDECTSALDPENQAAVIKTIQSATVGRTTLMITHKLPMMQMSDRILVMHEGVVAEEGSYDDLMRRNGIFAQLARGGTWERGE